VALLSVGVRHFRNLETADIPLAPSVTLFTGANAQGKTNLLEAILLLLSGLSLRGQSDRDMVAFGEDGYRLHGIWEEGPGRRVEKERTVSLHPLRRRETGPRIPAVAFGPDDLMLVKGGPEFGRRFLDDVASQIRPRYLPELRRYQRALSQRNRSLKNGAPDAVIDSFDPLLAEAGSFVWAVRLEVVTALQAHVPDILAAIAPSDRMAVSLERGGHASSPDAARLMEELVGRRGEERRRGMTLTGPHRDDLRILANDRDAGAHASQGQQRSIALALKLASRDMLEEAAGRTPVVLLDDVFSELDGRRRDALLALVGRARQQTVVTDTDRAEIRGLAGLRYEVEAGAVRPVG